MKRQVGIMISIVLVSFLVGTMLHIDSVAMGGRKPSPTQAAKPEIMTVSSDPAVIQSLVVDNQWHDLLNITITLNQNASVLAIGTTQLYGSSGAGVYFGHRLNNTWYEYRADATSTDIVEVHFPWLNLTAGTYTFAFHYNVPLTTAGASVRATRLTLMIIY